MSSADALAATIGTGQTDPDTTDATEEVVESQEEVDDTTETPETEETEDDKEAEELPDPVKEILKKNRKELREEKALRIAAEKALSAKTAEEEAAPADDKFKTLFVNTAAKAALAEAGLSVGTDRFLKMLDLSSVEVDDSGNVTGLEDQIDDLKEEFKDLLAPKVVKKTVTKVDGAGRRDTPEVPKSSAERLAARLG